MRFWRTQTYVSQIWRQFALMLIATQLLFIMVFFVIILYVGMRLGEDVSTLLRVVDVDFAKNDPVLIKQVTHVLNVSESRFRLVSGVAATEPLPIYPGLLMAVKTVDKLWQGKVSMSYQEHPMPILWVQKTQPPLFAVGVSDLKQAFRLNLILMLLTVFLITMLFMARWIAKRISMPLLKLSEDAQRMGSDQFLTRITPDSSSCNEIIVLTDALNTMRADIYGLINEREILLAEISHDLRTPLSRLRIAVELLPADASGFIEGMKEDVDEISTLLKQTIELAHAHHEADEPWIDGDINQLLTDVHHRYHRSGILLTLDLTPMPRLSYKTLSLTRLIYNLIDNGLQHGKGQVTLLSRLESDTASIVVISAGIAASKPALTASGVSFSSGLGLLIVERIAKMHGATLTTHERSTDGGREVVLSFGALSSMDYQLKAGQCK